MSLNLASTLITLRQTLTPKNDAGLARDQKIKIPTLPCITYKLCNTRTSGGRLERIFDVEFTQLILYQRRYTDVLVEKMFFTLTERNNILRPKALIHISNTCCLRILRDPFLPQEQRIEVLMFCYWSYYPFELGTEIIQFDDHGRICGAHRRKFVKNQIKPKKRTSLEVSKWSLLKDSFRLVLKEK